MRHYWETVIRNSPTSPTAALLGGSYCTLYIKWISDTLNKLKAAFVCVSQKLMFLENKLTRNLLDYVWHPDGSEVTFAQVIQVTDPSQSYKNECSVIDQSNNSSHSEITLMWQVVTFNFITEYLTGFRNTVSCFILKCSCYNIDSKISIDSTSIISVSFLISFLRHLHLSI